MKKKLPVVLAPYIKTRNSYEKLKICSSCNHFTVLGDVRCPICGKQTLRHVERRAQSLLNRSFLISRAAVLVIAAAGIAFSDSSLHTALMVVAGTALLALLWTLQRRWTPALLHSKLEKIFKTEAHRLVAGLTHDRDMAIEVFQSGDRLRTYEMLREIGALVQTDQLRLEQILLLQSFVLRKDMDLMLEPLLMNEFNTDLAEYMGELAKIRRDLLKENAFRYATLHESRILRMEHGESIMIGIAGAAIRLKRYITLYPYLIMRYADKLPKERFLRLYRMIKQSQGTGFGPLHEEVMRVKEEKYKWDEDFR